jgi:hypothetical protein
MMSSKSDAYDPSPRQSPTRRRWDLVDLLIVGGGMVAVVIVAVLILSMQQQTCIIIDSRPAHSDHSQE